MKRVNFVANGSMKCMFLSPVNTATDSCCRVVIGGLAEEKGGKEGKEIGSVFKVFWKVSPELELRSKRGGVLWKRELCWLAGGVQQLP
jgi:hypothetical protein